MHSKPKKTICIIVLVMSFCSRKDRLSVATALQWQLMSVDDREDEDTCILCQDGSRDDACMVMSGFVQLSSVLSKRRCQPEEAVRQFGDITNPAGRL